MVELRKDSSKGALAGSTVVELVTARNELRKIQREIGRVNSRTQIDHLMKNRKKIVSQIEQLEALLSKKSPSHLQKFWSVWPWRCGIRTAKI
jgi:hypothetical protein